MFFWAALRPPSPRAPPAYSGGERPGPSPEVLGRELAAHDLFHVGVLVAEFDVIDLAFLVAVFEDLVTAEGSALLNDPEPPVDDALAVVLAPLA
jgi:hypothetical protein